MYKTEIGPVERFAIKRRNLIITGILAFAFYASYISVSKILSKLNLETKVQSVEPNNVSVSGSNTGYPSQSNLLYNKNN